MRPRCSEYARQGKILYWWNLETIGNIANRKHHLILKLGHIKKTILLDWEPRFHVDCIGWCAIREGKNVHPQLKLSLIENEKNKKENSQYKLTD